MARIELDIEEKASKLLKNFCKRTGMTALEAANRGLSNCIEAEAHDALRRLVSKGQIPDAIVEESDAGMVA